eukprot:m.312614 g.312614  ORF g.312614 m.312614 type:complete len:56 (+) comp27467_c0_seq7:786-953(+)
MQIQTDENEGNAANTTRIFGQRTSSPDSAVSWTTLLMVYAVLPSPSVDRQFLEDA